MRLVPCNATPTPNRPALLSSGRYMVALRRVNNGATLSRIMTIAHHQPLTQVNRWEIHRILPGFITVPDFPQAKQSPHGTKSAAYQVSWIIQTIPGQPHNGTIRTKLSTTRRTPALVCTVCSSDKAVLAGATVVSTRTGITLRWI